MRPHNRISQPVPSAMILAIPRACPLPDEEIIPRAGGPYSPVFAVPPQYRQQRAASFPGGVVQCRAAQTIVPTESYSARLIEAKHRSMRPSARKKKRGLFARALFDRLSKAVG